MFGKDLVVVADFDGSKTVEEMQFTTIPIWVRVTKMPLGLMNKEHGEAIGDLVGEFMEMDVEDGESAVGQFLRVKVKLDIKKPLMRGVTLTVERDGGEKEVWCPLMYEFLPDFCYTCVVIGHVDKMCDVKLGHGEPKPYSSRLRFIPEKKKISEESNVKPGFRPNWRSGGSGNRLNWSSGGRSGSDGPSWRKNSFSESGGKDGGDYGEEVTSPMKEKPAPQISERGRAGSEAKKMLQYDGEDASGRKEGREVVDVGGQKVGGMKEVRTLVSPARALRSPVQTTEQDATLLLNNKNGEEMVEEKSKKSRYFKRVVRAKTDKQAEGNVKEGGEKKRALQEENDMEVDEPKRKKVTLVKGDGDGQDTPCVKARPADRPCEQQ